ncbi:hypothetical protein B0H14DRAFT_2742135 [Mycena olivaceomarginata]|nr:hypothetical protein B0H14DRAFT_2742135 [Mycena olivaceomarginata]
MESISRQLRSFRLGYTEERPYPWKWTTPIVLSAFLLISAFLAALNVPLSAYNIVQEFTYRPNETLPVVALSSLVPSVFQPSANSFTPQLLTVGDVIKLNGSLFEYTIVDAFDGLDETNPVSSFSYYNNPLSEGCDVTNVTFKVAITCRVPTLFHLVWSGVPPTINITMTAHACCICDTAGAPETTTLLEPPCSLTPPGFMATEAYFTEPGGFSEASVLMDPLMSTEALDKLASVLGNVSTPDFTSAIQNIFQAVYHLVRVDLGVILDNQIYNSPQMFNLSIMPVNLPAHFSSSFASTSRAATSNSTLMAQWRQRVAFFQTSDRVPVMDYLRPVPRLKPLGSAITSVFVSTFAMLSALWTIFSLGAGALARRTAPQSKRSSSTHNDLGGRIGRESGTSSSFDFHKEATAPWKIPLEYVQEDIREMRRTMDSMRHLLEKQGLLDRELKTNSNSKDDILSCRVHRTSASSGWA